ncbi:hypothetical protein K1719_039720 [Acacia pycnantha]|nr:hypothetical protein K1719_039720 [Acacia pycnantha]
MEGSHHSHPQHHHHYLMWLKRKQMLKSHIESAAKSSSLEERAFAEDAARILGGYVWPPRSYSCTFCKREFRSAQALGGHMNVHRRDRARLKQTQATCLPLHDCNNNKRSSDSEEVIVANNNGRQQEEDDFAGFISHHHHNNNHYYVETDLSMGLLPSSSSSPDEEALSCKRPKFSSNNISSSSVQLPVFIKPFSSDHAEMEIGVHNKPKMDDLDLELRLGKSQKVK